MRIRFQTMALLFSALLTYAGMAEDDGMHWSFRPLKPAQPPLVKNADWARTPVDTFVLAGLNSKEIEPSRQADARKLVRRIYFDLAGLPPTVEQARRFFDAFARESGSAVESLVEELLASPHYGERWARHWLDVARYADSNGQESDQDRPTAYHYRDFVIRALNADFPFDAFLRWQLAGDELEPDDPMAIAATGFIVAGTHAVLDVPMEEEKIRTRYNELDDMISTTGSAMLGLTLGCARCHDHKYDPIPTRDYYSLLGAFNSGDRAEVPLARLTEVRARRAEETKWKSDCEAAKKRFDDRVQQFRKPHETAVFHKKIEALKIAEEDKVLLKGDPKNPRAKELAGRFSKELKIQESDFRSLVSDEQRAEWDTLEEDVKAVQSHKPAPLPTALAFADLDPKPRDNWLLARGDFRLKREPLELGFLSSLIRGRTVSDFWSAARSNRRRDDSTQQRRAVAEWLTDLEHGAGTLAARAIVNRVWQHHFGEGLARTVNDLGIRGDKPTHPELLEWLTNEFVKSGWRLKPLHRLIMTSAVYLQDTAFDAVKANVDAGNRLLWRCSPRRIESEILRDSMLAVSETLNTQMFGPAFKPPIAAEAIQARNMADPYPKNAKDTPATRRRTLYMFHKRVVQYPMMQVFDGPDAQASCGRRGNTTVAPQALALLNDRFVRARAEDFARRLEERAGRGAESQVRLAWRMALAREPSATELVAGAGFINNQAQARTSRTQNGSPDERDARRLALADFCQAVFALNEFVYVD